MIGICNSVGGGVLFVMLPSVPFPSPHASSQHTRQPPPPLLMIRYTTRRNRHVVGRATDRRDDRLVQQHMSTDRTGSQGTKFLAAAPL